MRELQLTGGARIGMANATIPFATLKVNKDRLELNASVIGNLTFHSTDIVSIEPYTLIPLIGQGIKINHNVSDYKERVIFWTLKNPSHVIQQIRETGFFKDVNGRNTVIKQRITGQQKKGGFPLKIGFAIGAISFWNLLFLIDFVPYHFLDTKESPIGNGVLVAVGLLFLTSLLALISEDFRKLILKDGRGLKEIKTFVIFILIVSAFMLSILTASKFA